ncbi:MAG: M48 family metalloprotease [Myxococcota bacterium]
MDHHRRDPKLLVLLLATLGTAALSCAVNPVTGERELTLVSTSQEVAIGQQQYGPMRQMEGGDFAADPELVRYVQGVGQKLAAHSPRRDLPYEFTVLNNDVPNAWALPGGKIAVNRGLLLALESEAQLAAVLGHEIVHAAARHGAKAMERAMLAKGALGAVAIATQGSEIGNAAVQGSALGAQLLSQKYGRDAELEADHYGMEIMVAAGYDPQGAVELQEIFLRLSGGQEPGWLEGLFASHPPSSERLEANRQTAARLAESARGPLVTGAAEYRAAVANLMRTQEAYAASAAGSAALARGDAKSALAAARKALAIEPAEPQFHALASAASLALGDRSGAEREASRAVELAPEHYAFALQRARVRLAGGDGDAALADLEKSLSLLPTADAHFELGTLLESRGLTQPAMEHYRVAASGGEAWLARAGDPLARLELSRTPERWITVRPVLDKRGYLTFELDNRAPFAVTDLSVEITRPTEGTQAGAPATRSDRFPLPDVLAPGQTLRRRTNIGPLTGATGLDGVSVRILSARPADR